MNNTMRRTPGTQPARRESTIQAILLGLLSIFEVTFDILSLMAALLGGFSRENVNPRNTSITTSITPEETDWVAPQVAVNEAPGKRPIGVTLITVLLGILGILEFGFGSLALVTSLLGHFIVPLSSVAVGGATGVYYILVGLVKLFFVWGLWRLQRWAFWATVFITALSLLSSVLALTEPSPTSWTLLLADLLLPTMILVYFVVDASVRKAFRI
jgi:uncharacterized membrane protein (DUF2068 family)